MYKLQENRFDPTRLTPAAREGFAEPGVQEYVALGMRTKKHRSIETTLVTAGSMRRIANAAGLTTPFVEMTKKQAKALAVQINARENPRPYQVFLRSLLQYQADSAEDTEEGKAEKERLNSARDSIKVAKANGTKIGPDDILTTGELNALLEAATSKRDRVLIVALLETGGRVSEVLSLNVEGLTRHQNDGKPFYRAWFGQMKEEGTEHFGYFREPASVALIDDWLASYPEVTATPRPLIPSLSHASNDEQRLGKDSIGPILQAVSERAGVEQEKHVHAHLFRHTRCSMLLREGVPEPMVKKIMGWKPTSVMIGRYSHLVSEDVEAALGLSAKVEGERAELLVPQREVPAMPATPFPLNPAINAAIDALNAKSAEMDAKNAEMVEKFLGFQESLKGRLMVIRGAELQDAIDAGYRAVSKVSDEEVIVTFGGKPGDPVTGSPVFTRRTQAEADKLVEQIEKEAAQ